MIVNLIEGVEIVIDAQDIRQVEPGPKSDGRKTIQIQAYDHSRPGSPLVTLLAFNPIDKFLSNLFSNLATQAT